MWYPQMHINKLKPGSCRKKDASQKLQQGREGNPRDRARVRALQGHRHCPDRIPDRERKRVMANGQLNGSFMAWPYIVLRNCWLKTMSWNPGQEDVVEI